MTNSRHTVLYTGVTTDLPTRVTQHKKGRGGIFTSKYKITKLVYFERVADIRDAIHREKQIKSGSRKDKVDLISAANPHWVDLSDQIG
jgi:putative endonuclease